MSSFTILIERDEDGVLVGTIPSIPGCHTQAKTLPVLLKRMEEVIRLCMDDHKRAIKPLQFVGLQELRLSL